MRSVALRAACAAFGALAVAATLLSVPSSAPEVPTVPAADVSQFNPGNIISDAVFFDGAAMSAANIQTFLSVKGASCSVAADGSPCLKNFRQDTQDRAPDAFCSGYTGAPGETAATIIAKVQQSCGISARVLLVVMQKEQSLVTTLGGTPASGRGQAYRFERAMGFACPDTAACDSTYFGFQNQVYAAARQYKRYAVNGSSYTYRPNRQYNILYQANNPGCGTSPVLIQNQATAGLYNYTPYQPNAAALAAGYGSGDACSAYGNRNFWLYYTDWFGSTQATGQSPWQPIGGLDSATPVTGTTARVRGWTVDPDTAAPLTVHVYVNGAPVQAATADAARPDIAASLPAWGPNHGYDVVVPISPGVNDVCVYAINVGAAAANPKLGCSRVDSSGLPFGGIDSSVVTEGQAVVGGWAVDPDTTAPLDVHLYVNGNWGAAVRADAIRYDIAAAYPAAGPAHGWSATLPLAPGSNEVCAYAINLPGGSGPNVAIGCQTLVLRVDPVGDVRVSGGATTATVGGWALDPETASPIDVHVYVDGQFSRALTASLDRPDVAAAFPGAGRQHGYVVTMPLAPGQHQICVYGINVRQGTTNPQLGCGTVSVGVPPTGNLEIVSAPSGTVRVQGWALDADTPAPIDVHLYVDGAFAQVVQASDARPDVAAVYPASGPAHGYTTSLQLSPGRHTVCAYAINVLGGEAVGNPSLGCLTVVVPPSAAPVGNLDDVVVAGTTAIAWGWTFDVDAPTAVVNVHLYVDGRFAGQLPAGELRPDVAAVAPSAGPAHGYTAYASLSPGRHTVCAYAIDTGGAANPTLGCRSVVVT